MTSRSGGKTGKILITIILIVLLPYIGHKIALNTSSSYNEMLDERAFNDMVESLHHSKNIERIEISSTSLTFSVHQFDDDIFHDMTYHSSRWNNDVTNPSIAARVYFADRLYNVHFAVENMDEGVFRTYYNERGFNVTVPSLKKFLLQFDILDE